MRTPPTWGETDATSVELIEFQVRTELPDLLDAMAAYIRAPENAGFVWEMTVSQGAWPLTPDEERMLGKGEGFYWSGRLFIQFEKR